MYKEIVVPETLVFTWAWEAGRGCVGTGSGPPIETLVTVEIRNRDGETEWILTHEPFRDAEDRGKHNEGWSGCLDRIRQVF